MKAWVLHGISEIKYQEIDKPAPGRGEVLLSVKAAGICGSDIPRIFETGAHRHPLVCGHEFSGQVEAIGEGVPAAWMGSRVGVFPLIPCKECEMCRQEKYEMCRNYNYLGSRCDGGFAEYVVVPEWNLIRLPETVTFQQAAMMEPMAVSVHAMRRAGLDGNASSRDVGNKRSGILRETDYGKPIAVIGAGTIGLLLVMVLLEAGYHNLFIIGNKEFQKRKALEMGIEGDHFCNVKEQDADTWLADKTKGCGFDVVFECVGKSETVEQALTYTAASGTVVLVGNPHERRMSFNRDVYWNILRHQLRVCGTWNSGFSHDKKDDWVYAVERIAGGTLHPEKLITHRLTLDNLEKGLHLMRDKTEDYGKVMVIS